MMCSMYIKITMPAARALQDLAQNERRDPREQAAFLIEKELERRGLLPAAEPKSELAGVDTDERTDQR